MSIVHEAQCDGCGARQVALVSSPSQAVMRVAGQDQWHYQDVGGTYQHPPGWVQVSGPSGVDIIAGRVRWFHSLECLKRHA